MAVPMNEEQGKAKNAHGKQLLSGVYAGKLAAANPGPADKFAANRDQKPFVGGFDQKLGVKRTT